MTVSSAPTASNSALQSVANAYISTSLEYFKQETKLLSESYEELGDLLERYVGDGTVARNMAQKYRRFYLGSRFVGSGLSVGCVVSDIYDIRTKGPNPNNLYNLCLDVVATTGLKGAAAVATIEAYRAAFNYGWNAYDYIDSKLNNINNWYNYYNFGF